MAHASREDCARENEPWKVGQGEKKINKYKPGFCSTLTMLKCNAEMEYKRKTKQNKFYSILDVPALTL